jgi:HEAT repeat protein
MSLGAADGPANPEELLLQQAGIRTDGPGLLAYLRQRTLSEDDRRRLEALIGQLGSEDFTQREQASTELVKQGKVVAVSLRRALKSADAEVVRRAEACLDEIERGPGSLLPATAVRLVVQHRPPGSVEVLLHFAPFADDESVEEEVLAALLALGLADGQPEPALLAGLGHAQPACRAAAAYVVGRAKTLPARTRAARLLRDPELAVRLRAAQGLFAAGERQAVPVLIDLLAEDAPALAWRAEELLLRCAAGAEAPSAPAARSAIERGKWRDDWAEWWRSNGGRVDLFKAGQAEPFLGLTLVPEMHGNTLWECGPDGKVRWQLNGLDKPRDAQLLPGGRVLIAEVAANRVTERDLTGKVLWSHPVTDPSYVLRLPSGNTFIGTHERGFEVTPRGEEVFSYKPPDRNFLIHSMHRMRNGHLVCLSMTGILREVDALGKEVRTLRLEQKNQGGCNWSGVEGLPSNRYLAVDLHNSRVIEVDATGQTVWECQVQGACYALRLPTGQTMVCSFSGQRVVHVSRDGKIVWEKAVPTSPWRAHFR